MATDSISKTKCSCEGGFYCGSCNYNLEFLCEKCWTLKYNKTILRLAKLDIKQKAAELASLGDPFVFWECPLIKKYLNGSIKDLTPEQIEILSSSFLIDYSFAAKWFKTKVEKPGVCKCLK